MQPPSSMDIVLFNLQLFGFGAVERLGFSHFPPPPSPLAPPGEGEPNSHIRPRVLREHVHLYPIFNTRYPIRGANAQWHVYFFH